LRFSWN